MAGYPTYQTFNEFFADQTTDKQAVITELRKLVKQTAPKLEESSKWGNGVWLNGDLPAVYAHVEPDHVQLGFFGGARLDDPQSVLEGNAKYVRHIKLRGLEDIDTKTLAPLIKQAAKLDYSKS